MSVLSINKHGQAMTTIPKELVDALQWKSGNRLLISKAPSQSYLIIENIGKEKITGEKARK